MKFLLALSSLSFSLFGAVAVHVPRLPESVYADTEVSTNVSFSVEYERLDKLCFIFDLTATATNNFEVLIGSDADNDGRLSSEESRLSFGYDCGAWFSRKGFVTVQETSFAHGCIHREIILRRIDVDPTWNLMRVVRRGTHAAEEMLLVKIENKKFIFIVR